MEIVCEDILLLIFKDLDVRTLYNLRRTNKWIKFIIDCNPKLFWYKHYDMRKIKYIPYEETTYDFERYNIYKILCFNTIIKAIPLHGCRWTNTRICTSILIAPDLYEYRDGCYSSPSYNQSHDIVFY
ncbi:F-box domain-containing protein [Orpheovirus IHUMI-LCC2]|uniref:F-box domain-containing protein n=1 Tax=Orpheovirus IHUMI-LCC2 TaxID=2023057 RepID=A0A2I2L479_9VIRU|nr:F-box domain-containing protein [Orpheovirus IHUMI-LCC2]SNW62352.1 F-box domain-containing protein [Orpheovirus IHUMI-LCC2]